MIAGGIVLGLLALVYGYFTLVVLKDPDLTRNQRILRLALLWLLPIFGLGLVSKLYSRDEPDPRAGPFR